MISSIDNQIDLISAVKHVKYILKQSMTCSCCFTIITSYHDVARHNRHEYYCSYLAAMRQELHRHEHDCSCFGLVAIWPRMMPVTLTMRKLWLIPPTNNALRLSLLHMNCAHNPTRPCVGFLVLTPQLHRICMRSPRRCTEVLANAPPASTPG